MIKEKNIKNGQKSTWQQVSVVREIPPCGCEEDSPHWKEAAARRPPSSHRKSQAGSCPLQNSQSQAWGWAATIPDTKQKQNKLVWNKNLSLRHSDELFGVCENLCKNLGGKIYLLYFPFSISILVSASLATCSAKVIEYIKFKSIFAHSYICSIHIPLAFTLNSYRASNAHQ